MKKTLICVIGNICAGKSTLIESVKADFEKFQFFSIDEYRTKHKATNISTEKVAIRMLCSDVLKADAAFLECVGTGAWFERFLNQCTEAGFLIYKIKIDTLNSACILREKDRTDAKTFCYDFDLTESVQHNYFELKKTKNAFEINGNQTPEKVRADFMSLFGK